MGGLVSRLIGRQRKADSGVSRPLPGRVAQAGRQSPRYLGSWISGILEPDWTIQNCRDLYRLTPMTETPKRVLLEMPEALYTAIDDVRGLVPRNAWIRDVLERAVCGAGRKTWEEVVGPAVKADDVTPPTRPRSHTHVHEECPGFAPVSGSDRSCRHCGRRKVEH